MQRLRNAAFLARLVLAWFVLAVGAAAAAPLLQPQSLELVCSGGGAMKLLVKDAQGGVDTASTAMDCPLCLAADAPPSMAGTAVVFRQPLGHALQPIPAARIASLTAAPLPARGPPPRAALA